MLLLLYVAVLLQIRKTSVLAPRYNYRLFIDCAPVFLFRLWLVAVAVLLTCGATRPSQPIAVRSVPRSFSPQRLNLQSGITAC